jgi:hypothetical protein
MYYLGDEFGLFLPDSHNKNNSFSEYLYMVLRTFLPGFLNL